ncbi:hypothetical protein, partial [Paenibacillus sp. AR247]|uniref:hypothetical protein n=1 Tax=Paenibacillus sp. AR247 TaxID=1631599 RepID=UPI0035BEA33B
VKFDSHLVILGALTGKQENDGFCHDVEVTSRLLKMVRLALVWSHTEVDKVLAGLQLHVNVPVIQVGKACTGSFTERMAGKNAHVGCNTGFDFLNAVKHLVC